MTKLARIIARNLNLNFEELFNRMALIKGNVEEG